MDATGPELMQHGASAFGVARLQDSVSHAFAMQPIALPRSDKRPIRFNGIEILEATSHGPGGSLWIELALYRKEAGGYAMAFKLFSKRVGEADVLDASSFLTHEALVQCLETFDPAIALPVPNVLPIADGAGSVAEQVIAAVDFKQRSAEARSHFSALADQLIAFLHRDKA
jgi:hypothetical protein